MERTIRHLVTFLRSKVIRPIRKAIKRKLKEWCEYRKFGHLEQWDGTVRENSVLLVEPHFAHGECMPGWTKYFSDLGYLVDVISRYENYVENPFCRYPTPPRFFAGNLRMIKKWLRHENVRKYNFVFISSTVVWDEESEGRHFLDYLKFVPQGKNNTMFVDHAPQLYFEEYNEKTLVSQRRIFTLSHLPEIPQLNPHYFGEFVKYNKNTKVVFLAIGRVSKDARNYDYVIDAARKMLECGMDNFCVRIIGSGKINIPAELKTHVVHLGRLDYPKMYEEVNRGDFIIAGLDPFSERHQQYLMGCTTGNLQLSLGFGKPMVINELFGEHYELKNAAIMYSDNDLFPAMQRAIRMGDDEYQALQDVLAELAHETYDRSISNLKTAIQPGYKTGRTTSLALMCKTYSNNLTALKILKQSIDAHNIDKIPFYIVAPSADIEKIKFEIITGKEDYKCEIFPEESLIGESLGAGWLDQQVAKLRFYKTNLCKFYLVLDSDSYFIKDFFVDDFMFDNQTPYIVCHEGKAGTILNTKFGNTSAMYEKEKFIKKFFNRSGRHYRFLTSPFIFSCEVCRELDRKYGADWCIRLCSCEASWHGEMLLSMGVPFKPVELFFEAMVYQGKLNLWRKLKITTKDISKQYLGIVMQDKLLREQKYDK